MSGKLDFVLFEGWRVGVNHPNFIPFNKHVDTLVYIKSDFNAFYKNKYEAYQRGMADNGGYDMYSKYGGFREVFETHYMGVYNKYIKPVKEYADFILHKDVEHNFTSMDIQPGSWKTFRDTQQQSVVSVHLHGCLLSKWKYVLCLCVWPMHFELCVADIAWC